MADTPGMITSAIPSRPKKYQPRLKFWLWPVIEGERAARWAVKAGIASAVWSVCLAAGVVLRMHFYDLGHIRLASDLSFSFILSPALFAAIAVGLYFNSRAAALIGPFLFVPWLIAALAVSPSTDDAIIKFAPFEWVLLGIVSITLFVGYISGIRGTFALYRIWEEEKTNPNC